MAHSLTTILSQRAIGTERVRKQQARIKTVYTSLNVVLSILYSVIFAVMLRRDRPQMRAQRPTLPRVFFKALRMYCCSMVAEASRSSTGSGRSRSMWKGSFGAVGFVNSGGRFSAWMKLSRDV